MNRREFARMLAIGGAAPLFTPSRSWAKPTPLRATPAVADERFWQTVRDQFLMPPDLAMLNAANRHAR